LAMAGASTAQAAYLSVGYFNGGGDVTAGPGGDIDKLDVTQITHLNYSFGLIYNGEKDETNAALKDPARRHQIYLSPKVTADLQRLPVLRKQNPELKVLLSVGGWGARGFSAAAATAENRAIFIRSALQVIAAQVGENRRSDRQRRHPVLHQTVGYSAYDSAECLAATDCAGGI